MQRIALGLAALAACLLVLAPPIHAQTSQPEILFRSDRDGNPEIYGINSDRTGLVRLTFTPETEQLARWNSDYSAFIHTRVFSGTQAIFQTTWPDLQDSLVTAVGYNSYCSWSNDGTSVLFSTNRTGNYEIWQAPADGSDPGVPCTNTSWNESAGTMNQFGEIVFTSNQSNPNYSLYILDACGGSTTPLLPPGQFWSAVSPDWSPDGQQIVFVGMTGPSASQESIYVVNRDGTGLFAIPRPAGVTDLSGGGEGVAWSPDGKKLVFAGYNGTNDLYIYDLMDSSMFQLTSGAGHDIQPSWAPGPTPQTIDISGVVSSCSGPLAGVLVSLDRNPSDPTTEPLFATTDGSGVYGFSGLEWTEDQLEISIVTPLGYGTLEPAGGQTLIGGTEDRSDVDFVLECLQATGQARGIGYWKHQAKVYVKNRGSAQESEADMGTNFPSLVFDHFHENQLNGIAIEGVTYVDVSGVAAPLDLTDLHQVLCLKGNTSIQDRARQHFLALLLNVASGKLSTGSIVSADDATVSQAIQQVADMILDGDPGNDESAKDICEAINEGVVLAAGVIDSGYTSIAYRRGASQRPLLSVLGNPSRLESSIRYELTVPTEMTLLVHDVSGRLIRRLAAGVRQPGSHTVSWDGRDEAGRQVRSGVYYVRLIADGVSTTRTIVRIP